MCSSDLEEPARRAMAEVVAETRRAVPDIERVVLWHRTGELDLSETSVLIVVAAPHRHQAFVAAELVIDTLKRSVPIWKQEHWAGGSDWAVVQHPIAAAVESVRTGGPAGGCGSFRGFPPLHLCVQRGRDRGGAAAQPASDLDRAQHPRVRARPAGTRARDPAPETARVAVRGAVLGRDLAIDLGTANTLVYARGEIGRAHV